ncbi:MAG: carboxylate--amine ligase [Chloroflexi bacterium]|nr:carboxylate--amine ligase [Chloroflexota bacterium]
MKILVLNRQKPHLAPFGDWLGDLVPQARLFTAANRVQGFQGFAAIQPFENYEESGLIEFEALRLHRQCPIERIVATSEVDILRAGRLRSYLGLPGQQADSALAFRNKIVMKQHLVNRAQLVNIPIFQAINEPFDLIQFIEQHGYPVIVKPDDGSGSLGAKMLANEDDLAQLLQQPLPRGLEIECFIQGDQYHIDGLLVDNEVCFCWPSQYLGNGLSFTKGWFTASQMLRPEHHLTQRLIAAAKEVLALLPTPPVTSFHLELFHTPADELFFCEIASRTGGGMINGTIEQAFGINLNQLFIQGQAGMPIDLSKLRAITQPKKIVGWGLVPPQAGIFRGYRAAKPPQSWVLHFDWSIQAGTHSQPAQMSVDQVGGFIVDLTDAPDPEERLIEVWRWAEQQALWEPAGVTV